MKLVIASVSQEAPAKYIFTVNPLPNLQLRAHTHTDKKKEFTNKNHMAER